MQKQTRLAFFGTKQYDQTNFETKNKILPKEKQIFIQYFTDELRTDTEHLLPEGFNAVCIFVNDKLDQECLERIFKKGIRVVALRCAGFDNVDIKTCERLGIQICRVPAYSPYAVAEHAIGLLLAVNRKIHIANQRCKLANFDLNGLLGYDLNQKTVGIIGLGRIGQIFAQICKGFGMRLLGYDPYLPPESWRQTVGIEYCDLDKIYKESDVISLHVPLNKDTKFMINKTSIDKMKPGVSIINTGRGPLVHTKDMIVGIKNKQIGNFAFDVYEHESGKFFNDQSAEGLSNIDKDSDLSILLSFPNVLMTGHMAFFTNEALDAISTVTLNNLYNIINTGKCDNLVTSQQ